MPSLHFVSLIQPGLPLSLFVRVRGKKILVMAECSAGWQKSWQNTYHFATSTVRAGNRLLSSNWIFLPRLPSMEGKHGGHNTW